MTYLKTKFTQKYAELTFFKSSYLCTSHSNHNPPTQDWSILTFRNRQEFDANLHPPRLAVTGWNKLVSGHENNFVINLLNINLTGVMWKYVNLHIELIKVHKNYELYTEFLEYSRLHHSCSASVIRLWYYSPCDMMGRNVLEWMFASVAGTTGFQTCNLWNASSILFQLG
jgi:hypothetical protein